MNPNYYTFAAFSPKNLSLLTEEWVEQLPKESWDRDTVRPRANEMGKALADRLFRDDTITNIHHGEFAQACLTLLGGASGHAIREGNIDDGWLGTLCANLYAWYATKLYHKDSGRKAADIVAEAMGGEER